MTLTLQILPSIFALKKALYRCLKTASIFAFALSLSLATSRAQSAAELNARSVEAAEKAEKELNTVYQALIETIRKEIPDRAGMVIERLRESQRAWLKYRETQVSFVGTYQEIGSSSARNAGMTLYSIELTKKRIVDLKSIPNPF